MKRKKKFNWMDNFVITKKTKGERDCDEVMNDLQDKKTRMKLRRRK